MNAKEAAEATQNGRIISTDTLLVEFGVLIRHRAAQGFSCVSPVIPETFSDSVIEAACEELTKQGYRVIKRESLGTLFIGWG